MIHSMTGFGKASVQLRNVTFAITVRTLNSKQLDLYIKLPHALKEMEALCRTLASQALLRGKVDFSISIEENYTTSGAEQLLINQELFAHYYEMIATALRQVDSAAKPDSTHILKLPGVMHSATDFSSPLTDEELSRVQKAIEEALQEVVHFRAQEGEMLRKVLIGNVESIRTKLLEIEPYETERVPAIRARLQEQLETLEGIAYDNGRLEQELIYYIEKLDVNEEKKRLAHHMTYFCQVLESQEGTIGKKLGFIAQEIGREINTLGSKSNHVAMQQLVVGMKDELEQIKEQILNVL